MPKGREALRKGEAKTDSLLRQLADSNWTIIFILVAAVAAAFLAAVL